MCNFYVQLMKIAMLTTEGRDWSGTYKGYTPWLGTAPQALIDGFSQRQDCEVHIISCTHHDLQSPDKIAPNIWYHSITVPSIGWLKTGYQGCIRAVRNKLKEIKPDIVHGQGTERDCAISAVFSGFPNVLTIHGNMRSIAKLNKAQPFSFEWCAAKLESFTLPRSNGVICITDYTRESVKKIAQRTWVVPNAVDGSFFKVEHKPVEPALLLCVGNISARKNQNNFIRTLARLNSKKPFRVIFLGGVNRADTYGKEFFILISKYPWCSYEGVADRSKLKDWFSRASGLVLPSIEDNCPMVVLEAMAAGLPVAAAAVGGVPDLIEDSITGYLFDPMSEESIKSKVELILNVADFRVGLSAKESAIQKFSSNLIARRHLDIYKEVLSG
jgi:glycosyltransferase involved in cell wall biosynthesis